MIIDLIISIKRLLNVDVITEVLSYTHAYIYHNSIKNCLFFKYLFLFFLHQLFVGQIVAPILKK